MNSTRHVNLQLIRCKRRETKNTFYYIQSNENPQFVLINPKIRYVLTYCLSVTAHISSIRNQIADLIEFIMMTLHPLNPFMKKCTHNLETPI